MATVFTKIIDGELPGRFVWSDDRVVGFLSINPLGPGHTLVVPRVEVDQWVDADAELLAHVTAVAHAHRKPRRGATLNVAVIVLFNVAPKPLKLAVSVPLSTICVLPPG